MADPTDMLPLPPASGDVIDVFPRQNGDGGLGSGYGGGVGAGQGPATPEPAPMTMAAAPASSPAYPTVDDIAGRWELRWMERRGLLAPIAQQAEPLPPAPAAPAMPEPAPRDPAGFDAIRSPTEPRRGSLRLTADGSPQQRQDGPAFQAGPPAPSTPEPPMGQRLLGQIAGTFLAASQGFSEGALMSASPVEDAEMARRLSPAWNDDGPAADRIRAARERASEMGIEVAFRLTEGGDVQAVRVTPEMQTPGGRAGRLADGLGRILGLGFVDPMGGAAVMAARGGPRDVAAAAASGGAP